MGMCDMCGSESGLVKAMVEGTELNVCGKCSKYGKVLHRPKPRRPGNKNFKPRFNKRREKKAEPESIERVIDNYAVVLRKAREKSGLTQEELGLKISEKQSIIQHMESSKFKPSIALAKKLEKNLHIKLLEMYKEEKKFSHATRRKSVTIGDLIKIKKR